MRNRLRFAEKVAGLSALALLAVLLFVDWFSGASGWDSLGWLALILCLASIVAGLAVPLVFGTQESPVMPLFTAICALTLGTLTVIALLVQVIAQPGPDELVAVQAGWWLGLLAAAGVARGGFLSMRDEYLPGVPVPDVPVRPAPVA
ncbi:MAG: hypothetical protein ACJ762_10300 [Solirubrobacteraceae bacterium]